MEAAHNWWIKARAVLSETEPREELNRAQFCYVVNLRQNAHFFTRPYILVLSCLHVHCPNFVILNKKIWFHINI